MSESNSHMLSAMYQFVHNIFLDLVKYDQFHASTVIARGESFSSSLKQTEASCQTQMQLS